MALNKLGLYIEQSDARNSDYLYKEDAVVGLSTQKQIIKTKADLTGVSLTSYKLVPPDAFAYVPDTSRRGDKVSLAHNDSDETYLVSSISIVFFVKKDCGLLSDYLFMYFNRPEFDRYARFNSWGSARETFSWEDMCDIDIELPSLEIQQKYVNVYKAMVANQKAYEKGLDDLKLVCDAYIEDLRRKHPCEKIGPYITRGNKNSELKYSKVMGIGQSGFINPQKQPNDNLANYKIANDHDIVYAPPLYNIKSDAIGMYQGADPIICSPIYEVFSCKEPLLAEYLIIWLKRSEFKRYAEFFALGVRNTFDFELMCDIAIPIPSLDIQKSIAAIYAVYLKRKDILTTLKAQVKELCPVLIQGALQEGRKEES